MSNPKYPVYIVSKGRWKSRLTVKTLEEINVPYKIIIEKEQYDEYVKVINSDNILVLPQDYLDKYDTCDGLDNILSCRGAGAPRNFAWDHALQNNFSYHWVLDDNIQHFYRLNRNLRAQVKSGTIFRCVEDFCERYENIAIAGLNYRFLCKSMSRVPPYVLNTRIYSCLFIRNSIPYRWRCRYNEDTDLSLRVLKDGWCTVLFNAFLCGKMATMTVKGGNTEDLYKLQDMDGRLLMAKSLQKLHPDITRIIRRFNRWQHYVDYRPFKNNKLIRKDNAIIPEGINEYGMKLMDKEIHDSSRFN